MTHLTRPRFQTVATALALSAGLACQAQTGSNTPDAPASALRQGWSTAVGLGLYQYNEPGYMKLSGPEATLQMVYQTDATFGPDRLQLDLGAALLNYNSSTTGNMDAVPALTGRGTLLWRLYADETSAWRAGLQLDMTWTDLRGTTNTGYRGYRRLGTKAWAVLQRESAAGARFEIGGLLRGRQDSTLSDAGQQSITNIQHNGYYLGYQHSPVAGLYGVRPWIRWSEVGQSTPDGSYFEPRNKTLQLGVLLGY